MIQFMIKTIFQYVKYKIQKCKYRNTNTQIQKYTNTKCKKGLACAVFLKSICFKDFKSNTPMCQVQKYRNKNTPLHKYFVKI